MASHNVTTLRPRHKEIIRLAFSGLSSVKIAAQVGISPAAISCVLRSPIAKAEIQRLHDKAEESLTNVPLRVRLANELNGAGEEALRFNRKIMNSDAVDIRVRSRVATHFLDRVVFDKDGNEEKEGSYRDLLRKLDVLADGLKNAQITKIVEVGSQIIEEEKENEVV